MMQPHLPGDGTVTHRCTGCGYMMTGPTEQAIDGLAAGALGRTAFAPRAGLAVTYYADEMNGEGRPVHLDYPLGCPAWDAA
jgi:hypothetical protein